MDAILNNIQTNFNILISQMNEQHFDKIRFASYRTACKIRFIQKKTNLYLIDLFNAIEIIREHDLHLVQDIDSEITVSELYQMSQLLFLQLNKRLPRSQNIDITSSITNLLSFMIYANDVQQSGKINVLFVKIVLCTLSSGKFQEKLKYIFSQIIDTQTGNIMMTKFCAFLKSLLQLACTCNEQQFYQYDEQVAKTIFHTALSPSLDIKSFIRLFYASNGPPPILSWFVVLHKMSQSEFVIHPTICSSCSQTNFSGFRYKCQKCFNYNLCQTGFWQGKATGNHNAETHSCKEYLNYKSPSKQLSNSLKRSFKLKSPKHKMELNDDMNYMKMNDLNVQRNCAIDESCNSPSFNQQQLDYTISNLTYDNVMECSDEGINQFEILPIVSNDQIYYVDEAGNAQFIDSQNPAQQQQFIIIENPNNAWLPTQPVNFITDLNFELDDEHRLIAQYAQSLANSTSLNSIIESYDEFGNPIVHSITVDSHLNDPMSEAFLNSQLAQCALDYENKNRELMMEIMRLRDSSPNSDYNSLVNSMSNNLRTLSRFSNSPVLSIKSQVQDAVAIEELCFLRERTNELENHLQTLLSSKEKLKNQLQNTIKMTENFSNLCSAPSSVNSTLNKQDAFKFEKDLNDLQKEAIKRDQEFKETEDLLTEELYLKSIQSHQDELDEEINKVQQEQKLLEEKELLDDFDRILKIEETANRLMLSKQTNQTNQTSQLNQSNLSNNLNQYANHQINNNNDETTSDDSLTLREDLKTEDKQRNLFKPTSPIKSKELESNQLKIESNNNIISSIENNYKKQTTPQIQSNSTDVNEETLHHNIMNRDIDLLLKQNSLSRQQSKANRINKYELAYGKKLNNKNTNETSSNQISNKKSTNSQLSSSVIPLIKKDDDEDMNKLLNPNSYSNEQLRSLTNNNRKDNQLDKRNQFIDAKGRLSTETFNSIDEISEANNSQTNSISSNTSYLKFDVKSQPIISFQSINFVQANRLSNLNYPIANHGSSLNKLMSLGSSNTSSDLPPYKMGESLDDSSLDTTRIPNLDICNLSTSTTDDELGESIKSSDTDTLIDEINNSSFNVSFD